MHNINNIPILQRRTLSFHLNITINNFKIPRVSCPFHIRISIHSNSSRFNIFSFSNNSKALTPFIISLSRIRINIYQRELLLLIQKRSIINSTFTSKFYIVFTCFKVRGIIIIILTINYVFIEGMLSLVLIY